MIELHRVCLGHILQLVLFLSALLHNSTGLLWELCKFDSDGFNSVPASCIESVSTESVYESLKLAGSIGDPLVGFGDREYSWVAESNWSWKTHVDVSTFGDKENSREYLLQFDAIYGDGDVLVDGALVLEASNSFISHTVPITVIPNKSHIELEVRFHSPVHVAKERQSGSAIKETPKCAPGSLHGFCGISYVRMPQYSFGWDWGPAFASVGFRGVRITPTEKFFAFDFMIHTSKEGDHWKLSLSLVEAPEGVSGLSVVITEKFGKNSIIYEKSVESTVETNIDVSFLSSEVSAWYPKELGDQSMYSLTVCVATGLCKTREFGFRYFEFSEKAALKINREQYLLLRGSNLVPTSAFRDDSGERSESFEAILEYILDSNLNVVRVWGGGFYGSDYLYRWADRNGILIWEEAKFACASYPTDDAKFFASIELELGQNFRRVHSHPSLLMVSGDNEVAMMLKGNWYGEPANQIQLLRDRYREFFQPSVRKIILREIGPFIPYIETSPQPRFDTHYYNYGADCRDVSRLPDIRNAPLMSEYGYQSWTSESCLRDYLDPNTRLEDAYSSSAFVQWRQHRATGNGEILRQIKLIFSDLDDTRTAPKWAPSLSNDTHDKSPSISSVVWYSQISQAVCLKSVSEYFLRVQPENQAHASTGLLYWQLNEVWPSPSWSLRDYCRNRKPAWYYTRGSLGGGIEDPGNPIMYVKNRSTLVVNAVESPSGKVNAKNIPLTVVDLNTGNVVEQHLQKGVVTEIDLSSVCPSGGCIAAVSKTNYILIGSVMRRSTTFYTKVTKSPVTLTLDNDTGKLTVTVSIPTPFLFLSCGNAKNFAMNMLFLFPKEGWNEVTVDVPEECEFEDIDAKHFWSYIDGNSAIGSISKMKVNTMTNGLRSPLLRKFSIIDSFLSWFSK